MLHAYRVSAGHLATWQCHMISVPVRVLQSVEMDVVQAMHGRIYTTKNTLATRQHDTAGRPATHRDRHVPEASTAEGPTNPSRDLLWVLRTC